MKITLSPTRSDTPLTASVAGDSLTLNGEVLDLSGIEEGAMIEAETLACEWVVGLVTRSAGEIALTLIMPHGANAPQETLFPAPLEIATDGPVTLPPYDAPEVDVAR